MPRANRIDINEWFKYNFGAIPTHKQLEDWFEYNPGIGLFFFALASDNNLRRVQQLNSIKDFDYESIRNITEEQS